MHEPRPTFPDAVTAFRSFLSESGWSTEILWLSSADITGYRKHFWVYRPTDLANERLSEGFYSAVVSTTRNVRIDGLFQFSGFTLAWVEDVGSDSGFLNYGIWTSPHELTAVTSRFSWRLRRALNRVRGETPVLQYARIPECA